MWPPFLFMVDTNPQSGKGLPLMTPHHDLIGGIRVTYVWT